MNNPELAFIAIILSGVVCGCQVLLCLFVFYLFLNLRRLHQAVERLSIETAANTHSTEPLQLDELPIQAAMPLAPQPGESITVLHREPYLTLPRQFAITDIRSQQNDVRERSTTESSVEHYNQGFDNQSMEYSPE